MKKDYVQKFQGGGAAHSLPWDSSKRVTSKQMKKRKELEAAYKDNPEIGYSSEYGVAYRRVYPEQTAPLPSQIHGEFESFNKTSKKAQDEVLKDGVKYLAKHLPQGPNPIASHIERMLLANIARKGRTVRDFKEDFDVEKLQDEYNDKKSKGTTGMKKGGSVKGKSKYARGDGCVTKGHTKGRMV